MPLILPIESEATTLPPAGPEHWTHSLEPPSPSNRYRRRSVVVNVARSFSLVFCLLQSFMRYRHIFGEEGISKCNKINVPPGNLTRRNESFTMLPSGVRATGRLSRHRVRGFKNHGPRPPRESKRENLFADATPTGAAAEMRDIRSSLLRRRRVADQPFVTWR